MGQGPHLSRQDGQRAVGAQSPETSKGGGAHEQQRLLGGQQSQRKQEDWGQGHQGQGGEQRRGEGARTGWGLGG